jgi:hypothetical protein
MYPYVLLQWLLPACVGADHDLVTLTHSCGRAVPRIRAATSCPLAVVAAACHQRTLWHLLQAMLGVVVGLVVGG